MRLAPILLLLLALPAAAQSEPESEARPALTNDQEAALFGLPVLTTAAAAALLVRSDVPAIALGLPLVPAATVCITGPAFGIGGNCLQAFRTTALWSLPGYALLGLGFATDIREGLGFSLALSGGLYLLVVPPIAAIESYRQSTVRAAPTVLSDPATHGLVPGVRLRIGL